MRPESTSEWPHGRYLVIDPDGTGHLPIRDTDEGPENHARMGDAHAALTWRHGFRGQPYAGERKTEAIAKLKTAYQQEGIDWPEELSADDSQDTDPAGYRAQADALD